MYITREQYDKIRAIPKLKQFTSIVYAFPTYSKHEGRTALLPYWDVDNCNSEVKGYLSYAFDECIERIRECEGQVNELSATIYQLVILNLMKTLDIELPFNMRQKYVDECNKTLQNLIESL